MSEKEKIIKESQTMGTQSVYEDASGKQFSAQDIVQGFSPKKPYKLSSLNKKVLDPNYGKVRRSE